MTTQYFTEEGSQRENTFLKILEVEVRIDLRFNESSYQTVLSAFERDDAALPYQTRSFNEIVYTIEITEGSVKAKVAVYATIAYSAVCSYGSFRQGAQMIIEDVEHVSASIHKRLFKEEVLNARVLSVSDNPMIVERLVTLTNKIKDYHENRKKGITSKLARRRSKEWKQELANLIDLLTQEEKQSFIECLPFTVGKNLPQPNEERQEMYNQYALKPDTFIYRPNLIKK